MKTLQNNFTTLKQSKRLLELGVPADSADCYINTNGNTINVIPEDSPKYSEYCRSLTYLVPCWSVGRLREIFCICSSVNGTREYPFCNDQVAWWITEFEFKKEFIDFTKLED